LERNTNRTINYLIYSLSEYSLITLFCINVFNNLITFLYFNVAHLLFTFLFQESIKISDGILDEKPLWEYPSKNLSDVYNLFIVNFVSIAQQSSLILKTKLSVNIKE